MGGPYKKEQALTFQEHQKLDEEQKIRSKTHLKTNEHNYDIPEKELKNSLLTLLLEIKRVTTTEQSEQRHHTETTYWN